MFRKIQRIRYPQFNMFHLSCTSSYSSDPIDSIHFQSIYSFIPQRIMTFPKSSQSSTTSNCIPISSEYSSTILATLQLPFYESTRRMKNLSKKMQDKCFLWPKNKENWRKTKEYCKKENGHLASITNIGIHNYFLSKLNRKLKDKETWFRVGGTD